MKRQGRRHLHGFVPCAADLEINAILSFERDLTIVKASGEMHDPERADQCLGIKASQAIGGGDFNASGRAHKQSVPLFPV
jgi:hypothetical protein